MWKVGTKITLSLVSKIPQEVKETIESIVNILDSEYGANRDIHCDSGGYILILENKEDFLLIKNSINIDLENDAIPEFVEQIKCKSGQVFTNTLILCNNDFGISIIMPLELTPENLKNYMID